MRIRYSKDDPRAGQEVELHDALAQRKIDAGEATEVKGSKERGAERNANEETEAITGPQDGGDAARRTQRAERERTDRQASTETERATAEAERGAPADRQTNQAGSRGDSGRAAKKTAAAKKTRR